MNFGLGDARGFGRRGAFRRRPFFLGDRFTNLGRCEPGALFDVAGDSLPGAGDEPFLHGRVGVTILDHGCDHSKPALGVPQRRVPGGLRGRGGAEPLGLMVQRLRGTWRC